MVAGWFEVDARMNSGILLVAAQRELRRSLFDALDQAGYSQIHSARDVSHAAILLEGRQSLSPPQLMVAVLAGDQQQALATCEQLRRLPGAADTPLMVVLAQEATISPSDLPAGIVDWLSAPQIGTELVANWRFLEASLAIAAPTGHRRVSSALRDDSDANLLFRVSAAF